MIAALNSNRKLLAWMPALLILGACAFVAAGINIVRPAHAATGTVDVSGTVDSALTFNGAQTCNAATVTAFTTGSEFQKSGTCKIEFYSNTSNGANLQMKNNNAGPFFCKGSHVCGGNDEFNDIAAAGPLADGDFGVALDSVANVAVAATGITVNSGGVKTGTWYPIAGNTKMCDQSATTNGTADCTFIFGGITKATQAQGSYAGQAMVTISDNP